MAHDKLDESFEEMIYLIICIEEQPINEKGLDALSTIGNYSQFTITNTFEKILVLVGRKCVQSDQNM